MLNIWELRNLKKNAEKREKKNHSINKSNELYFVPSGCILLAFVLNLITIDVIYYYQKKYIFISILKPTIGIF